MKMSAFPNLRGEAKEVAESYYETLKTKLTGNDKIVINALSELANENKSNAKLIIEVIERRVFEVRIIFDFFVTWKRFVKTSLESVL